MHLFDCLQAINKITVAYLPSSLQSIFQHFVQHEKNIIYIHFFVPVHPFLPSVYT